MWGSSTSVHLKTDGVDDRGNLGDDVACDSRGPCPVIGGGKLVKLSPFKNKMDASLKPIKTSVLASLTGVLQNLKALSAAGNARQSKAVEMALAKEREHKQKEIERSLQKEMEEKEEKAALKAREKETKVRKQAEKSSKKKRLEV